VTGSCAEARTGALAVARPLAVDGAGSEAGVGAGARSAARRDLEWRSGSPFRATHFTVGFNFLAPVGAP
jgi:hypothetical protein